MHQSAIPLLQTVAIPLAEVPFQREREKKTEVATNKQTSKYRTVDINLFNYLTYHIF
jgi:hypothetical protein